MYNSQLSSVREMMSESEHIVPRINNGAPGRTATLVSNSERNKHQQGYTRKDKQSAINLVENGRSKQDTKL